MAIHPEITAWLIGSILGLGLLMYCAFALFGDRARGRRRCPSCGHAFGDLPGLRCPECGHEATSAMSLLRPRRHWRRAGIGFMLLLLVAMIIRVRSSGNDWLTLVPDRPLVWLIPLDGDQRDGAVVIELKRRLLHDTLSDGASSALLERLQHGDHAAAPGTKAWDDRYGRLARVWGERMENQDDPVLEELLATTPQVHLRVPLLWPAAVTVPTQLLVNDYWPHGTEGRATIRWHNGDEITRISFRNYAHAGRPYFIDLPPAELWPTEQPLALDVEIQSRRTTSLWNGASAPPPDATWNQWSTPRTFTIDLSAPTPINLDLTGVRSKALDDLVARMFAPGLRRFTGTNRPFAIRFDTRVVSEEVAKDLVFGVEAEIIETPTEGEPVVRRRSRIWIHHGLGAGVTSGWEISAEDSKGLAGAFEEANQSTWTMRLKGDWNLATRAIALGGGDTAAARTFWNGELEIPLTIHRERGTPFIRRWFLENGPPRP